MHAVVVAVHFVFAQADAARAGHGAKGETSAGAGILAVQILGVFGGKQVHVAVSI